MLAAGAVAVLILWWWTPIAKLPACPVYEHAGVYCPGCGSLRATHRLLTGRFEDAFRHNALLVALGVPLAAWYWGEQFAIAGAGYRFRPLLRGAWLAWLALALLLVFAVARNLPGDWFEALRPPGEHTHATPD